MQLVCGKARPPLKAPLSQRASSDETAVNSIMSSPFTSSFRKHARLRPGTYRTPSPPRSAVEPLSPCLDPGATNVGWDQHAPVYKRDHSTGHSLNSREVFESAQMENESRNRSSTSMDLFASIALATQSQPNALPVNARPGKCTSNYHTEDLRPKKRARSEKLPFPDLSRKKSDSRTTPSTSNEQSTESRMKEAELLLHFSQRAIDEWSTSRQNPRDATLTRRASESLLGPGQAAPLQEKNEFSRLDSVQDQHKDVQSIRQDDEELKAIDLAYVQTESEVSQHRAMTDSSPSSARAPATKQLSGALSPNAPSSFTCNAQAADVRSVQDHQTVIDSSEKHLISLHTDGEMDDVEPIGEIETSCIDLDGSGARIQHNDCSDVETNVSKAIGPFGGVAHLEEVRHEVAKVPDNKDNMLSDPVDTGAPTQHGAVQTRSANLIEDASPIPASENPFQDSMEQEKELTLDTALEATRSPTSTAVCAACNFTKNSVNIDSESQATSWINCDGCKSWFHFACAGFKTEREVRGVDKYRCRKCRPIHGATTYVRKSSRAHSAIDYAGLHQGVIKTSDDRPEHHYIQPIRDGTISFRPDNFARMRPELVTAEHFEKGSGMKEPVVIPAILNPQPGWSDSARLSISTQSQTLHRYDALEDNAGLEEWFSHDPETHRVPDEGQDALDMVMPQGLTVRKVAELYGPDEKVEVIDVKSQNGENKKWTMKRWVDYYESPDDNKIVRNVISLEVSQSRLGRLIRRPKIVRDLDLQDGVWPRDLLLKGEYPRVQFYCLMSVADCFTDFHIDFGGSSVFYHILKGKKTFLFIPPKEKHLKKYEEWCMSPAQNWTFLADQTKECYRVDLSEGDTMLIPSGWIHAVWTPEDSLVIGGNFLTRMNYAMQLRIAQVEKATGVARKFRYPHFQKLHWYTVLKYLEEDPLPDSVRNLLECGLRFERQTPTHHEFDNWGENSRHGPVNYHARYYSQPELEGLADLVHYVRRTVMIDNGSITEGISVETRNAVKKSIPRGHGEPMDIVKTFAIWCAWKRGNELIPYWAYSGAVVEIAVPDKLSAIASKRMAEEAALRAPRRHSARMQSQKDIGNLAPKEGDVGAGITDCLSSPLIPGHIKRSSERSIETSNLNTTASPILKRPKPFHVGPGSHRKTACDSCRRRRRACKHKELTEASISGGQMINSALSSLTINLGGNTLQEKLSSISGLFNSFTPKTEGLQTPVRPSAQTEVSSKNGISPHNSSHVTSRPTANIEVTARPQTQELVSENDPASETASPSRPRTKACNYCRKSKVSPLSLVHPHTCLLTAPVAAMYT